MKIESDLILRVSLSGRLGKLGLKINGGRDRPCVPGDPGIFITAVKRGSVLDKVIGPGDKILKVLILKLCAQTLSSWLVYEPSVMINLSKTPSCHRYKRIH